MGDCLLPMGICPIIESIDQCYIITNRIDESLGSITSCFHILPALGLLQRLRETT